MYFLIHSRYLRSLYQKQFGMIEQCPLIYVLLKDSEPFTFPDAEDDDISERYRKVKEDCHYQPKNLMKLFLRPNVTCLRRRGKEIQGEITLWPSAVKTLYLDIILNV
ncbi:hypothetical protein K7X08_007833 [Anisodus acutangulus]|uniref:Uncharacterized protein n=1 Tax=Anisodus acutangulus TaxID=402998 RepID=A0A9Q1MP83_9SOLA|nr:hypothetical protein K7X08_007833 [Anisodus acutangulus]